METVRYLEEIRLQVEWPEEGKEEKKLKRNRLDY
jgi:hypothetical protein